jgi:hypothetical protein
MCFVSAANPDKADWRWPPTRSYTVCIPSTAPEAPSGAIPDAAMISAANDWAAPFDYDTASTRRGKRARDTSFDTAAKGRADIGDLGGECRGHHENAGDAAND